MSNDSHVKDLPLFPFTRDRQLDLPSEYEEVAGGCPVAVRLWNEQRAWLIGSHADFLSVLVDARFSGQFGGYYFLATGRVYSPSTSHVYPDPCSELFILQL